MAWSFSSCWRPCSRFSSWSFAGLCFFAFVMSVNTEITDNAAQEPHGWILYDGDCELCRRWARRFEDTLVPQGFVLKPLQAPWARQRLGLEGDALLTEMRLLLPDGRVFGGADALVELSRRTWWGRPFFAFTQVPGVLPLLRACYRRIASRRHCKNGACALPKRRHHAATTFFESP
ncbi:MAG: DUF393 domain-containing protein [Verrucomicrobia bacterium]|nr:DUF393 domain-containing protein [Verrucomicrobiota bacterium]